MHLKNLNNNYAQAAEGLLGEIPKAVWAAIAVSSLTCGGDHLEYAAERVAQEWQVLHQNGVVAQKPGKVAKAILANVDRMNAATEACEG